MSRCPDKFFVTTKNLVEGDKCTHGPTEGTRKSQLLILKQFDVFLFVW